jgi:hypothetical protein
VKHARLDCLQDLRRQAEQPTFAARSRVVQYRHSSGCFVFVSTSNRSRRTCLSASPFIWVA